MSWQAGKVTMPRLTQRDFERLLEFRVTLRRFQRWSEDQAQAAGLTQVQHQLLNSGAAGHPLAEARALFAELAGDRGGTRMKRAVW